MGLREKLNENPHIAWSITVVAVLVAGFFMYRSLTGTEVDSVERRSEMVTIRDTLTGDEWEMNRGQFERLLMTQQGLIDPQGGIPSQFSDGKPVGVLVDKTDWESTVARINALKEKYGQD